jgi:hypothetical protein
MLTNVIKIMKQIPILDAKGDAPHTINPMRWKIRRFLLHRLVEWRDEVFEHQLPNLQPLTSSLDGA